MDALVQEFNSTIGQDTGVRVRVSNLSSAAEIGGFQGSAETAATCSICPTCSPATPLTVAWARKRWTGADWFTEEELSDSSPAF